jgi:hypothetical protein
MMSAEEKRCGDDRKISRSRRGNVRRMRARRLLYRERDPVTHERVCGGDDGTGQVTTLISGVAILSHADGSILNKQRDAGRTNGVTAGSESILS